MVRLIKNFFVICLVLFVFLSIKNIAKAGGNDCMSMAMCPPEYDQYVAVDPLANVIFHDVPPSWKSKVETWMHTPWGCLTFKTVGGRNNHFSELKDLSSRIYSKLGEHYGIPKILWEHFVIARESSTVEIYFDSFGPSTSSVSGSLKTKINSEARKIFKWMYECRKRQQLLPLEDALR